MTVTETLHAMPHGTVTFHRGRFGLSVHLVMYGLTSRSPHVVDLLVPGLGIIPFSPFDANYYGDADKHLSSTYKGAWKPGSRLVIRMGSERNPVAHAPISETAPLERAGATAATPPFTSVRCYARTSTGSSAVSQTRWCRPRR